LPYNPVRYVFMHSLEVVLLKGISLHICLLTAITATLFGCAAQTGTLPLNKQIAIVDRGNVQQVIMPSGNLSMPHSINLTFGSAGPVTDILVNIGDQVKQGQVLAKLDTLSLEAALLQAQVNLKTAQYNLRQALDPGAKSTSQSTPARDPATIEIKQLLVSGATMSLDNAQRNLDEAVMKAPFDGLIGIINIKIGDIVSANTIAIRLVDPQQIRITVQVNEADIYKVKVGAQAVAQIDALSTIQLSATVSAIGASTVASGGIASYPVQLQVNTQDVAQSGSQALTQKLAQIPGQMPGLKEGLTVTVTIVTAEKNNVLRVPLNALIREGDTTYVQVSKNNDTIEKRKVQTGLSTWQYIEITDGLNEGEKIVIP